MTYWHGIPFVLKLHSCLLSAEFVFSTCSAHPRFGETQVVKTGPLAAPSRVFAPGLHYKRGVSCISMWIWSFLCFQAGVYRIAGAVLTGAGNATIGIGGTVEGITSEATGPHQWGELFSPFSTEWLYCFNLVKKIGGEGTSVCSIPHLPLYLFFSS